MKNLFFFLLVVLSGSSLAQQFDVEVIVFKRNIAPEKVGESWPNQLPPLNLDDAIRVTTASASEDIGSENTTAQLQARGINLMPAEQFQLNTQYEALKNHAGFTPLAHIGWRQNSLDRDVSPQIRITGGQNYTGRFLKNGAPVQQSGMDVITDNPDATTASKDALFELDGMIRLYVQTTPFVDTTFDLREPHRRERVIGTDIADDEHKTAIEEDNHQDSGQEASTVQFGHLQEVKKQVQVDEFLKAYRLEQTRKLSNNEVHYIDHPLMGLLIQVRSL
ncbi:peptidoglycan binding protein CsiV [Photobacterium ganghwense]|uniref:peptidoglycan binding protein CsiV n=1 Tax=Photobacterium ganghwense TaxID=320778 RepID=UPI001C2D7789|nr:peptidoglycan binding protein CsiV [Photobacterium ganghwense]MBV1842949.1 peptidoglycan binding protein CsiV [Photobacterium ganghwense]